MQQHSRSPDGRCDLNIAFETECDSTASERQTLACLWDHIVLPATRMLPHRGKYFNWA